MSVSVSTDGSDVTLNFSDLPDQRITTNEVIRLGPGASMVGDFDSNGSVDFLDFFMFGMPLAAMDGPSSSRLRRS